jgi:hypothetical protein
MRTVSPAFSLIIALALGALHQPALAASAASLGGGGAGRDAPHEGATGFLDIASDPPAKITIDDADTGKLTPQPRLELPAGHHKVTLVTQDGAHKRTLGFTIQAGETTKLTLHLSS